MIKSTDKLTSEDIIVKEYFVLSDIVKDFDQRLLTIKGWGVTLSLASLGLGFQVQHYGLFLVAVISALAFWAIESVTKKHQMRHYLRMRDIEVLLAEVRSGQEVTIFAPLIDWSWSQASKYFSGECSGHIPKPQHYEAFTSDPLWPSLKTKFDRNVWIYPHIYLPHILTIISGLVFFMLGIFGVIKMSL